jgi:quercetin dioxygenase-like cupin family protein
MANPDVRSAVAAATVLSASLALAATVAAGSAATPKAGLKWTDAGVPGVKVAVVQGDMAKGASHFYLLYPPGFSSPRHHHSPDHYATTVSGQLVLVTEGKEHRLPPGSYFAFTDKAVHAARCEGNDACVMFIDALGPWDVVPEKP